MVISVNLLQSYGLFLLNSLRILKFAYAFNLEDISWNFGHFIRCTELWVLIAFLRYISEKTDEGGIRDQNEADAGPIAGEENDITTSGVQESLEQLQLNDGQGDRLTEADRGLDDTDAQRIINIPSNTDFIVARATHPGQQRKN